MNLQTINPSLLNSPTACPTVSIDIIPQIPTRQPSFLQKIWSAIPSIVSRSPPLPSLTNEYKPSLFKKIWNVVSAILNIGLGLMLYWTNNSLFAISIFIGIIRDEDVAYSIKKIKAVWDTQPFNTLLIGGFGSILGGIGSFLSFPVTFATGTILYAANLGSYLSKRAQEILAKKELEAKKEREERVEIAGEHAQIAIDFLGEMPQKLVEAESN